jgi:hypothetical protein
MLFLRDMGEKCRIRTVTIFIDGRGLLSAFPGQFDPNETAILFLLPPQGEAFPDKVFDGPAQGGLIRLETLFQFFYGNVPGYFEFKEYMTLEHCNSAAAGLTLEQYVYLPLQHTKIGPKA